MKKKVMLKEKLLRVSIVLIALFTATIFFVTDNKVNNLVEKTISAKVESISNLGLNIIKSRYDGDWNVKDGKLFIGENLVNNNFEVVDEIKEKTGSLATIYLGNERVATNELDKDGERTVGTMVSNEVAEIVLKKGVPYERAETVLGEKYSVKYVPIKDNAGKVIGMWSVGIPKSSISIQGSNILAMRASIVVISVISGILGCGILILYSKRFLKGVDTHKVAFLGAESKSNKTRRKVLSLSLFLIGTFLVIWVTIQGFTIGNVVNNLEYNNIKDRLNTSLELGYTLINEQYKGDWSIKYNKLYKGTNSFNDNYIVVDRIGSNTEYLSTIFMGDTVISTNILKSDGTRPIGTKASNKVIETVLKQGKEYTGETTVAGKRCIARYIPLKDRSGKTIGMWVLGVEKKLAINRIAGLRKAITQISLLAIIIAFATFLFLSIKMVSDIKNFNVSLHTSIN
ncbi:cache domain-containing protein [Acetivibrio cellulolyticus]|uniref:cache domain-containing protein n=1 Tax=Acetivibrio cellulolyticus TaxID=35830 RepID=UPI0001E30118|nr:cache domain-containing protein [Acetivibrio cellulolyticus]